MSAHKVAIVAALEREVSPIVKRWRLVEREHEGREFRCFENDRAVLVCGGIGQDAARRATEAVISIYKPMVVISAGFAGAMDPKLKIGMPVPVGKVIDAADGSSYDFAGGSFTLITVKEVAGAGKKQKLANAYGAHAETWRQPLLRAVRKNTECNSWHLKQSQTKWISNSLRCSLLSRMMVDSKLRGSLLSRYFVRGSGQRWFN